MSHCSEDAERSSEQCGSSEKLSLGNGLADAGAGNDVVSVSDGGDAFENDSATGCPGVEHAGVAATGFSESPIFADKDAFEGGEIDGQAGEELFRGRAGEAAGKGNEEAAIDSQLLHEFEFMTCGG